MSSLPWDEIQLEATRVLQECIPPPPPPPPPPPSPPPPIPRNTTTHPRALVGAQATAHHAQLAATQQRLERLEQGRQEQANEMERCATLVESAHLAARDGTRALRLAHRQLLLRGRRGGGRPLSLDQLRVLIDTGLLFVGEDDQQQWEGGGKDKGRGEEDGAAAACGLAEVAAMVEREAATQRQVAALEKANRALARQQRGLARLLARTVAALEELTVSERGGSEGVVGIGEERAEGGEEAPR